METTLDISGCPDQHRVRYAAGSFEKRALTWWNAQVQTRGRDEALAMPWEDFKTLLRGEFCPRNELKKVETELLNHVMIGAEHLAFTTRFHELATLAPDIVPTLEKRIERYVGVLPPCIRGHVIAAHPTTLEMAVTLSASLIDVMVASGALKKGSGTTEDLEQPSNKKRKVVKNFVATTTAKQAVLNQPPQNRGSYSGTAPFCNKCNYHHQPGTGCRQCTYCGKMGHWVKFCKEQKTQHRANQAVAQTAAHLDRISCYTCGEPGHYAKDCPKRVLPRGQAPRGRAYQIGTAAVRQDTDTNTNNNTGTFII
ncbi:hypothetical protein E3N88_17498 [Mikania micrantha]|uniref:CCHC-type domain-containing protein n=1 Tax=Mikania micrantha TaxID=192012 RepID=A0A5N6NS16_9ASTR|nr:hypothetical protein E3N88_17498 [Mikania micrantha]